MFRMPCATQCSANLTYDWFVASCTHSFLCCTHTLSGHIWLKRTQHGVQLADFTNSWKWQEKLISELDQMYISLYIISSAMHAFWLDLIYDLLEDRPIDDIIIKTFFLNIIILYHIKQIDSKLPCVCSEIDHSGRRNVVKTSVTYLAVPRVPHFDIICDLLLSRCTATWNLFVNSHPNISMLILHTVLYTFPKVLTGRICLTIKSFFTWWPFPLFSWP